MPKKPKKYSTRKELKAIARERVGSPPPARILTPRDDKKKPKHKKKVDE